MSYPMSVWAPCDLKKRMRPISKKDAKAEFLNRMRYVAYECGYRLKDNTIIVSLREFIERLNSRWQTPYVLNYKLKGIIEEMEMFDEFYPLVGSEPYYYQFAFADYKLPKYRKQFLSKIKQHKEFKIIKQKVKGLSEPISFVVWLKPMDKVKLIHSEEVLVLEKILRGET